MEGMLLIGFLMGLLLWLPCSSSKHAPHSVAFFKEQEEKAASAYESQYDADRRNRGDEQESDLVVQRHHQRIIPNFPCVRTY